MLSWMAVMKMKKCPTCIGIGSCDEGDPCPTCEGTGEIPTDQVIIDEPCQPIVCLPKALATSRT
jgi:DnaJ-class molecular chaperone